jgi:hypothetical protein
MSTAAAHLIDWVTVDTDTTIAFIHSVFHHFRHGHRIPR